MLMNGDRRRRRCCLHRIVLFIWQLGGRKREEEAGAGAGKGAGAGEGAVMRKGGPDMCTVCHLVA